MSVSASAMGSTIAGSSKHTHLTATHSGNDELSSIQSLIVNALGITFTLHERGDIRIAYAKYLAICRAVKQVNDMKIAGTWTEKPPTLQEISGIFVSKSAYFNNHNKIFPNVSLFPAMEKWLLNGEDAPEDSVVWGNAKHTFTNLEKILQSHGAPASKKGGNKGKKTQNSASEESEDIGKGKSKEKPKEKEKAKAKEKERKPHDGDSN